MSLLDRIKSLFHRPSSRADLVPFYDVPSRRLVHIPPSELRPGCVQARIQGVSEEIVWVLPEQLQQGEIRHPPFDEEVRSYIRDIQSTFAEHGDWSVEQWEESFRRDGNPMREIAIFAHAADVYRAFTEQEHSPQRRQEIYRLLVACMTASPESVWHVVKLQKLSRHEAEQVAHRFHHGTEGDSPAVSG